jgi:hypothetical protein
MSTDARPIAERIRAAAELLEEVVADRALLAEVSEEERNRFLRATGLIARPDANDRRRLQKATRRERRAERAQRAEEVLSQRGIRKLRQEPVFVTPMFAPAGFGSPYLLTEKSQVPTPDAHNCYICKRDYTELHHFYDQLCPPCAELNFAKRGETGRPHRPRRAAHRRAREDRLPGGDQAAARGRAPDRHHALPARLRGALRGGAGLRGVGAPAWRYSGWTCATRPASRRSAASSCRRTSGWTSSSTTPARRCAARPSSTAT